MYVWSQLTQASFLSLPISSKTALSGASKSFSGIVGSAFTLHRSLKKLVQSTLSTAKLFNSRLISCLLYLVRPSFRVIIDWYSSMNFVPYLKPGQRSWLVPKRRKKNEGIHTVPVSANDQIYMFLVLSEATVLCIPHISPFYRSKPSFSMSKQLIRTAQNDLDMKMYLGDQNLHF